MRTITWAALFVLVLGGLAIGAQGQLWLEAAQGEFPWRCTATGWERATWLPREVAFSLPSMHPAMLAFLEVLVSVAALIAFPALLPQRGQSEAISRPRPAAPHRTLGYRFRPGRWNKRPAPHRVPPSRFYTAQGGQQ